MATAVRTVILAGVLTLAGIIRLGAAPILALDPIDGAISGDSGTTIGWGFTLTNPDNTYLVITSADFCGDAVSSPCDTPLGTFTDFIAQYSFTALDPGVTVTTGYDPATFMGIGSYTLNASPGDGSLFLGQIVLTYDVYENGLGIDPISFDNRLTAAASVSVNASPVAAVPEPSTFALLSIGLVAYRRRSGRVRLRVAPQSL